jgi:hypothetical protein
VIQAHKQGEVIYVSEADIGLENVQRIGKTPYYNSYLVVKLQALLAQRARLDVEKAANSVEYHETRSSGKDMIEPALSGSTVPKDTVPRVHFAKNIATTSGPSSERHPSPNPLNPILIGAIATPEIMSSLSELFARRTGLIEDIRAVESGSNPFQKGSLAKWKSALRQVEERILQLEKKEYQRTMNVPAEESSSTSATEEINNPSPDNVNAEYANDQGEGAMPIPPLIQGSTCSSDSSHDDADYFNLEDEEEAVVVGPNPSAKANHGVPRSALLDPTIALDQEPLSSLTGTSSSRRRIKILRKLSKQAKVTKGSRDLQIINDKTPRIVLDEAVQTDKVVLAQLFLADPRRVFDNGIKTFEILSAPLSAVYREFSKYKRASELYDKSLVATTSNEAGTGLIAKLILGQSYTLETYEVRLWSDAAIFKLNSNNEKPSRLSNGTWKFAHFSINIKLDLTELTLADWLEHEEDIKEFIAVQYEAAYLNAILTKAEILVLGSVLENASKNYLFVMIDVLARVHRLLSPYLPATTQVQVVIPELAKVDLHAVGLKPLKGVVDMLDECDASVYAPLYRTGKVTRIDPSDDSEASEEFDLPNNKKIVVGLFELDQDELFITWGLRNGFIALSRYFVTPAERKVRGSVEENFLKLGNREISTRSVVIDSLVIHGTENQQTNMASISEDESLYIEVGSAEEGNLL